MYISDQLYVRAALPRGKRFEYLLDKKLDGSQRNIPALPETRSPVGQTITRLTQVS
jgi:hypothetical protein